jgi:hypothetical protein
MRCFKEGDFTEYYDTVLYDPGQIGVYQMAWKENSFSARPHFRYWDGKHWHAGGITPNAALHHYEAKELSLSYIVENCKFRGLKVQHGS